VIEQYVSPQEFKRLMSALLAVLCFIAVAAFFAFMIVPGMRYQVRTSDEIAIQPVQGESGWLDATDYLPSRKQIIPPIDPKTVMEPTPELLARGKALFTQTCATCHGPEGHGDGPGGKGLNPPPRNFTANANWKNGTRIEDIYKTLDEGIKGSSMASYNYLMKKDRMALVHYVRSLGEFDHGKSDPNARAALENLFTGSGEVIPNRIPVKQAVELLIAEYRPPELQYRCDFSAQFGSSVVDPARARMTLAQAKSRVGSDAALAQEIAHQAPSNGFDVSVDFFSAQRWNQLRSCAVSD
jgi:mono/diheme cytochrome c family protein